ncbi:MAG: hypothetical protein UR26_C0001G0129 [candidate division TM6 bacterium GW2011_GWF2_32_72]|nr:MAG: hypothetical protein UR26_C0001G0129 [candidate division TM6 bacterium GW2011_GWF2_32_72]
MFFLAELLINFFFRKNFNQKTDLIVFSYDRPIQLYAFLESVEKYVLGLNNIYIIYRSSDLEFDQGYDCVKHDFSNVIFCKQKNKSDFKHWTAKAFFQKDSNNVIFAVDDIIIKDFIDLKKCVCVLIENKAYGFYLRLGKNITESYSCNIITGIPQHEEVAPGIFKYRIFSGAGDWCYPNTVDMTLYRKKDIALKLFLMPWDTPNSLEAAWSKGARFINKSSYGLFLEESKIINIPANLVQNEQLNRYSESISTKELLLLFQASKKINIEPFFKIKNKSPHMECKFDFINR